MLDRFNHELGKFGQSLLDYRERPRDLPGLLDLAMEVLALCKERQCPRDTRIRRTRRPYDR